MRVETLKIEKLHLLIVEGKDEQAFFEELIKDMQLSDIQVLPIGGKTKLREHLKALSLSPRFTEVVSIGVVRDANNDAANAFQSVHDALKSVNLPSPQRSLMSEGGIPRVTIMILPGGGKCGMLEDLCLEAVSQDSAIPCVENYFNCLGKQGVSLPNNISKAKFHVFLASRPEPDKRLGEAAKAGFWSLRNKAFDEVKTFLNLIV